MEADQRFKFTPEDLIIIQWTSAFREDRYVGNGWKLSGGVYNSTYFKKGFLEYCSCFHFLLRDYATIKAVDEFLKSKNCQYHFLSMLDIATAETFLYTQKERYDELKELYKDVLGKIKPGYLETIFNGDWNHVDRIEVRLVKDENGEQVIKRDGHPTPLEHYWYLKAVLPELPINDLVKPVLDKEIENIKASTFTIEWNSNINQSLLTLPNRKGALVL
jgi:hypothetical protein